MGGGVGSTIYRGLVGWTAEPAASKRTVAPGGGPSPLPLPMGRGQSIEVARERGASMIVVGSRGAGGFRELLLGSVSNQLVTHAVLAVVVVPDSD